MTHPTPSGSAMPSLFATLNVVEQELADERRHHRQTRLGWAADMEAWNEREAWHQQQQAEAQERLARQAEDMHQAAQAQSDAHQVLLGEQAAAHAERVTALEAEVQRLTQHLEARQASGTA